MAATWDLAAAERRFYLDGEEIDSGADFSLDWDGSDFLIGKELDDGDLGSSLDGKLDDLRVYDRALSDVEIRAHYDAGG